MSSWFLRNRHLYPDSWPEISYEIKVRDGFKCKECGVPDKAIGFRDESGEFQIMPDKWAAELMADRFKIIQIHLTVAHLGVARRDGSAGDKKDKSDCRPENLAALCQRCHIIFDIDEHVYNSALTRRRKRIEAGQLEMAGL
jgi:hypothetical protein